MTAALSIIIPCYNRADLVGQTVRSVLDQPATLPFEVIAVDDGSTDDTLQTLRQIKAAHPLGDRMTVISQSNQGECPARNTGIAHATGDYLLFLDSDDLLLPWSLSALSRVIESHAPGIITYHPLWFHSDQDLQQQSAAIPAATLAADPPVLTHTSWYAASAVDKLTFFGAGGTCIARKHCPQDGGFAPHRDNSGDIHFLLRVGHVGPAAAITLLPLFAYRQHPGNISGNPHKIMRGWRYIVEQDRAGTYGPPRPERDAIIAHHLRIYTRMAARQRRLADALSLYRLGLGYNARSSRSSFNFTFPLRLPTLALRGDRKK